MGFNFLKTQKFSFQNGDLFKQIKASFTRIIRIDPTGQKTLISPAEALEVATGVIALKSLAESNDKVKTFFKDQFGTFDGRLQGQRGQSLFAYLEGIDTQDCGASTIKTLLEPWAMINKVMDFSSSDEAPGAEKKPLAPGAEKKPLTPDTEEEG